MFVMRGKREVGSWLGVVVMVIAGGAVDARAGTVVLTNWGSSGLGLIVDGTSNTLLFTETTRMSFCFGGVSVRGATGANPIQDGTSNTIQFGESVFPVHVGYVSQRRPLTEIADGSSNTILIGEIPVDDFCVGGVRPITEIGDGSSRTIELGEGSTVDVCLDNVRSQLTPIADGTSNTIVFGEVIPRTCYSGVRVNDPPTALAPEPATATLLLLGLSGAALARRRRR